MLDFDLFHLTGTQDRARGMWQVTTNSLWWTGKEINSQWARASSVSLIPLPGSIPSKSSMVFSSFATDLSANSARVSAWGKWDTRQNQR